MSERRPLEGASTLKMFDPPEFVPGRFAGNPSYEDTLRFVERRREKDASLRALFGIVPARVERSFIILAGAPGSGKSTLAQRLSILTGIVHLEKDVLNHRIVNDTRSNAYAAQREVTHDMMHDLAHRFLQDGHPVLYDTTHMGEEYFPNPQWHARIASVAAKSDAPLKFIECRARESALLSRLKARFERTERELREIISKSHSLPWGMPNHFIHNSEAPDYTGLLHFLAPREP